MKTSTKGFSLIELLVALSILAVVAAIIVPKFLGINVQAGNTAAQNQASELAKACYNWVGAGGMVTGNPTAGDWLLLLSSTGTNPPTQRTIDAAPNQLIDNTNTINSQTIGLNNITANAQPFTAASTAASIAAGKVGFQYGAAGSVASYCDGQGDAWVVTIANTGSVTFQPCANSSHLAQLGTFTF
jgi:prepilin-type N-terminal cleavage/methylation domain-containing protein